MSWISDDGLHEGYLLPEFGDGQRGRAIVGGGVPADQVIIDVDYSGGQPDYATRPASDVVGWRVMCDCRSPFGDHSLLPESERWRSGLLLRVASAALEDARQRRIFAIDENVTFVGDREVVGRAVHAIWWRQHVFPFEALREIEVARSRLLSANHDLERAVRRAIRAVVDVQTIERSAESRGTARRSQPAPDRPGDAVGQEVNRRRSHR